MTGKPIEIKLDADTRGAEAGADRVADAMGDVEDAVDGVHDAGENAARTLGDIADKSDQASRNLSDVDRSLSDVDQSADDAARGLDKIKDSADETADAGRNLDRDLTKALDDVADQARRTGDDLGDSMRDGVDRAGDGLNDFKEEAAGSAREGAASFTGSFDDVGGFIQETLANALGGFGPIGAAAGVAAAVGFGTLYTAITEQAEKTEDRISTMYEDMLESQSNYLSKSYVLDELEKIASGADDAIIGYEELQRIGEAAGVSLEEAARAYIGGGEDLNALLDRTRDKVKRNTELQTTGDLLALQGNDENTRALQDRQKEIDKATDRMSKFNDLGGRKLNKEIEMHDNAPQVDRRIDRASRDRRTDVHVDDRGTARRTQRAINELHARDVPVNLYVPQSSIDNVYNTVDGIRLPAIEVQVRYGQAAV